MASDSREEKNPSFMYEVMDFELIIIVCNKDSQIYGTPP